MWRIRSSTLSFKEIPVVEHENISIADLGFTPPCLTNVGRLTCSHDLPFSRAPRLPRIAAVVTLSRAAREIS
jgi:hypothetical protein